MTSIGSTVFSLRFLLLMLSISSAANGRNTHLDSSLSETNVTEGVESDAVPPAATNTGAGDSFNFVPPVDPSLPDFGPPPATNTGAGQTFNFGPPPVETEPPAENQPVNFGPPVETYSGAGQSFNFGPPTGASSSKEANSGAGDSSLNETKTTEGVESDFGPPSATETRANLSNFGAPATNTGAGQTFNFGAFQGLPGVNMEVPEIEDLGNAKGDLAPKIGNLPNLDNIPDDAAIEKNFTSMGTDPTKFARTLEERACMGQDNFICGHGRCAQGELRCICDKGYGGPFCMVPACSLPCENNGTCMCILNDVVVSGCPPGSTEVCNCMHNWIGKYCEVRKPDPEGKAGENSGQRQGLIARVPSIVLLSLTALSKFLAGSY